MVDPGEVVSATLKREFAEEALNALAVEEARRKSIEKALDQVFQGGVEVTLALVNPLHPSYRKFIEQCL